MKKHSVNSITILRFLQHLAHNITFKISMFLRRDKLHFDIKSQMLLVGKAYNRYSKDIIPIEIYAKYICIAFLVFHSFACVSIVFCARHYWCKTLWQKRDKGAQRHDSHSYEVLLEEERRVIRHKYHSTLESQRLQKYHFICTYARTYKMRGL